MVRASGGGVVSLETYDDARNGVARYQPVSAAPAVRPRTVVRLTEWAESAKAAHDVATSLVKTSFVPAQFRDQPHEATAAILAGDEVGLSPMASLRAFDIIQGTAAPRAIALRAIVQSRGHEVWVYESTSTRAIVKGRRAGSDRVQESVWDLDRARGLGLLQKDNWKKQAGAMLVARASSEVCRLIASDAILGLPYAAEELADGVYGDLPAAPASEPPAAAAPARRTAQRRTQPRATAPQPETPTETVEDPQGPPLPGEDGYEEPPPPADDPVTRPQLTKLHTIFSKGGIENRDTRLAACSLIVGRELDSSADLTKNEAIRLIETLDDLAKDPSGLAEMVAELVDAKDGDPS